MENGYSKCSILVSSKQCKYEQSNSIKDFLTGLAVADGKQGADVVVGTGEGGRDRGETVWMYVLGVRAGDGVLFAMALVSLDMAEVLLTGCASQTVRAEFTRLNRII